MLIEKLLPNPQYRYGTNDTEDEIGKITFAKQLNVQQTADDGTGITAYNTYEEIHTTSFSFSSAIYVCLKRVTPPEGRLIR